MRNTLATSTPLLQKGSLFYITRRCGGQVSLASAQLVAILAYSSSSAIRTFSIGRRGRPKNLEEAEAQMIASREVEARVALLTKSKTTLAKAQIRATAAVAKAEAKCEAAIAKAKADLRKVQAKAVAIADEALSVQEELARLLVEDSSSSDSDSDSDADNGSDSDADFDSDDYGMDSDDEYFTPTLGPEDFTYTYTYDGPVDYSTESEGEYVSGGDASDDEAALASPGLKAALGEPPVRAPLTVAEKAERKKQDKIDAAAEKVHKAAVRARKAEEAVVAKAKRAEKTADKKRVVTEVRLFKEDKAAAHLAVANQLEAEARAQPRQVVSYRVGGTFLE